MTESSDVEDMRRYLEDTLTLLRTADEPVVNYSDELHDDESEGVDEEEDDDDEEYGQL